MTPRLLTLSRYEARLQFRYGIYIAYGFVLAFYLISLTFVGDYLPNWVPALVLFSDPSVLGFFFIGALLMLEKAENTRNALAMTPISGAEYFGAKAVTLTTASLISVSILASFVHQHINWPLLLLGSGLAAIHYLGIGVPAALRFKTVSGYMVGAIGWLTPITLPCLFAFMDPMPLWTLIFPAASQFRILLVATGGATATGLELIVMLTVSALAAILGAFIGIHGLKRELGNK